MLVVPAPLQVPSFEANASTVINAGAVGVEVATGVGDPGLVGVACVGVATGVGDPGLVGVACVGVLVAAEVGVAEVGVAEVGVDADGQMVLVSCPLLGSVLQVPEASVNCGMQEPLQLGLAGHTEIWIVPLARQCSW